MNSVFIFIAAMIVLMVAYILYGGWLAERWGMNPKRKTPSKAQEDGEDYVSFRPAVVFGHQLSAFTGFGTIQGTVMAAAFGWLPVFLWLVLGTVFLGAAQNMAASAPQPSMPQPSAASSDGFMNIPDGLEEELPFS